jgi:hypothetical protein
MNDFFKGIFTRFWICLEAFLQKLQNDLSVSDVLCE